MLSQIFSLRDNFRHLSRRPNGHEPVLDGLRSIAILLVVAMHVISASQFHVPDASSQFNALPVWIRWLMQGYLGVDMFFVLSGFLIGGMLFSEHRRDGGIRLGNFFARRALRLVPLYWVALGITALYVLSGGNESVRIANVTLQTNIGDIWKNFLYVNNFFSPADQFSPMGHSWSLAVEEQFYLLFPLLLILFFGTRLRNHPRKLLFALVLLFLVFRVFARIKSAGMLISVCGYAPEELAALEIDLLKMMSSEKMHCLFNVENDVVMDNLYTRYFPLLAGVCGAYLKVFREDVLIRLYSNPYRSAALIVASLTAIAFGFLNTYLITDSGLFHLIYQTLFAQMVFATAVCNLMLACIYARDPLARTLRSFLGLRGFYVVAQLSYSMYLFNLLMVRFAYELALPIVGNENLLLLFGTLLPILIVFTAASSIAAYLFVERPFMNARAFLGKSAVRAVPAPA